jgi:exodeoxyribonuclease-3
VPDGGHYTFWDYRIRNALARGIGWRVDHIWATEPMARQCRRAWIDVELRRSERPSDHAPILTEFEL